MNFRSLFARKKTPEQSLPLTNLQELAAIIDEIDALLNEELEEGSPETSDKADVLWTTTGLKEYFTENPDSIITTSCSMATKSWLLMKLREERHGRAKKRELEIIEKQLETQIELQEIVNAITKAFPGKQESTPGLLTDIWEGATETEERRGNLLLRNYRLLEGLKTSPEILEWIYKKLIVEIPSDQKEVYAGIYELVDRAKKMMKRKTRGEIHDTLADPKEIPAIVRNKPLSLLEAKEKNEIIILGTFRNLLEKIDALGKVFSIEINDETLEMLRNGMPIQISIKIPEKRETRALINFQKNVGLEVQLSDPKQYDVVVEILRETQK